MQPGEAQPPTLTFNDDQFWLEIKKDKTSLFSTGPADVTQLVQAHVTASKKLSEYESYATSLFVTPSSLNDLKCLIKVGHNPYLRCYIPRALQCNYKDHEHFDLYYAIATGNVAEVKRIAAAKSNLTTLQLEGYTALQFAVRNGFPEVVKALWPQGTSVNSPSLLVTAITSDFPDTVQVLLDKKVDVDASDDTANYKELSPLHVAIGQGSTRISLSLLRANAKFDSFAVRSNQTPLMLAAEVGNLWVSEELLQRGANKTINLKNTNGIGALQCALECSRRNLVPQMLKMLFAAGATVDSLDLIKAAMACEHGKENPYDATIFPMLLDRGIDINTRAPEQNKHRTAVHFVAENKRPDLVQLLVSRGASLDHIDTDGNKVTPDGKIIKAQEK